MSTVKPYLKALLALSGDEQLATPRLHLLQSINDDDLSELLKRAMERDFARGAMEDIILVILDVIARDPVAISDQDSSGPVANAKPEDIGNESDRTPALQKVTLLCQAEQLINKMVVPRIDMVRWIADEAQYSNFSLSTSFVTKFDEDYLSSDLHISEWGKLLRLREKGVASQCCVNDTVIMRAKHPGQRTGDVNEACDRCSEMRRLCARLVKVAGVIKLAFLPLPRQYRGNAMVESLDHWVRK